jgi:hypothetical protein
MGRSGNGPGELGAGAGPLLLGAADTLVVPDLANQRVSLFATDGSFLSSYRVELQQGIPVRWESTANGIIVNQVRPFALPNQPTPAPDSLIDAIVARGSDGTLIDTLFTMPSGKTFRMSGRAPEFNFFTAEPAWTVTPEMNVVFGVNDRYSIAVHDAGGGVERIITKPYTKAPVTDQDEELFTGALEKAWQNAGVPPQALPILKQGIHFADTYPAYLQFMWGPSSSLWVQHIQSISSLSKEALESFNPLLTLGGPNWDIFDSSGRYLGTMTMPTGFQPVRFVGDRIYGIWRDELEVQYVMALQIRGLPGEDTSQMPVGG